MSKDVKFKDFAERLLAWHARHGRHDLPWTRNRTPYRVWLSEIMLQQTQVSTVVPYFERFTAAFPDVAALAEASQDEVLHLWSGLGYYSRARNLHATAKLVTGQHAGKFPSDIAGLSALPGIGRSTAGAIVALASDARAAILDGNVKRVLARYHAVAGWPGESAVLRRLWALAEAHVPQAHYRNYTQAMMDLGATVCTRRNPLCASCPLAEDCRAGVEKSTSDYPGARPRRVVPLRQTCFLVIENSDGTILLERRPAQGVWGGLWCFPESDNLDSIPARTAALGLGTSEVVEQLPEFTHTFTHFRLKIQPVRLRVADAATAVHDSDSLCWYSLDAPSRLGLSTPVTRVLKTLPGRPG